VGCRCGLALVAALGLVLAGGARPTEASPVTLRIVFPEGFTIRKMADRVSEVRKIAIRKRHVTPKLTGVAYKGAAARARAPRAFRPYLNTRRFRGLPPTPIGNPGVPSMRAAARPALRNYRYFLRKPNSVRHFFTADEEEFCAKVREYGYGEC
jgi:YceG-like family